MLFKSQLAVCHKTRQAENRRDMEGALKIEGKDDARCGCLLLAARRFLAFLPPRCLAHQRLEVIQLAHDIPTL
jgi:hypothetical protein